MPEKKNIFDNRPGHKDYIVQLWSDAGFVCENANLSVDFGKHASHIVLHTERGNVPITGHYSVDSAMTPELIPLKKRHLSGKDAADSLSAFGYKEIVKESGVKDPELESTINRVGNRLVKSAEEYMKGSGLDYNPSDYKWEFNLVDDTDGDGKQMANAFCYPGGKILVYKGLFDQDYVESDDELAFILGHEIAHQICGHPYLNGDKKLLLDAAPIVNSYIKGDSLDDSQLNKLKDISLKRNESVNLDRAKEDEADKVGIILARNAGYDVSKSVDFFGKFRKTDYTLSKYQLFLDHDLFGRRIQNIESELYKTGFRPLDDSKYTISPKTAEKITKAVHKLYGPNIQWGLIANLSEKNDFRTTSNKLGSASVYVTPRDAVDESCQKEYKISFNEKDGKIHCTLRDLPKLDFFAGKELLSFDTNIIDMYNDIPSQLEKKFGKDNFWSVKGNGYTLLGLSNFIIGNEIASNTDLDAINGCTPVKYMMNTATGKISILARDDNSGEFKTFYKDSYGSNISEVRCENSSDALSSYFDLTKETNDMEPLYVRNKVYQDFEREREAEKSKALSQGSKNGPSLPSDFSEKMSSQNLESLRNMVSSKLKDLAHGGQAGPVKDGQDKGLKEDATSELTEILSSRAASLYEKTAQNDDSQQRGLRL